MALLEHHPAAVMALATVVKDRLVDALRQIEGAYSFVCMTNTALVGARDPLGVRPLVLGKLDIDTFSLNAAVAARWTSSRRSPASPRTASSSVHCWPERAGPSVQPMRRIPPRLRDWIACSCRPTC